MTEKVRPPGPTWKSEASRPLKQRLAELAKGTIPLIRSRFAAYGDIYFVDDGKAGTWVLRHPDHIHDVFVERAADFHKRSKDLEPFLGSGLLTSNGELWRRQRRLVQPAFRREKLEAYANVMVADTQTMLERWTAGDERDIGREMMELTLSVVAKTLLGVETSGGAAEVVASAMHALQETTAKPDPFPDWVPTPLHKKRKRAAESLDGIIYPMIAASTAGPDADHLLGQLKHASDEEGTMSKRQLRDELVTLFLAGHETTALAMTWTFYLLAEHPEQEATLHAELDRVLEGRVPTGEDVPNLLFTELCFKEALRMFPPIYFIPRVAIRDTKIGEFDVDEGANVLMWIYLCHRDERWFPNPDAFIPGRFLEGTGGVRHPHAYLPFGAGMRQCIGSHFAMMEGTLLLAAIAQRFRLRRSEDVQIHLNPRVTLGPDRPILMKLEPR